MIKTKIILAQKLNIARSTLDKYLSLAGAPIPGPDGWDSLAVLKWIQHNADSERTLSRFDPAIRKLKCRELSLRCSKMAFQLEIEQRKWIPASEVCSCIKNAYQHQSNLLRQVLEVEMPVKLAGLDPIQIRLRMVEVVDRILGIQRSELFRWMESPPEKA